MSRSTSENDASLAVFFSIMDADHMFELAVALITTVTLALKRLTTICLMNRYEYNKKHHNYWILYMFIAGQ